MAKTKTSTKAKDSEKTNELNLDAILFKCRNILRTAKNSGSFFEKRDMMLTLVFLRFIGEKYENGVESLRKQLIEDGLDPYDENIISAFLTMLHSQTEHTTLCPKPDGVLLSIRLLLN